jgi:hypothetical protein
MFRGWDAFYTLLGTTAGALISLLFVVMTLSGGRERPDASRGIKVFLTPVVFHFAVVIAVSATALAPGLPPVLVELALAACAVTGFGNMLLVGLQFGGKDFQSAHWTDFWCYAAAPALTYLALGGCACALRIRPDMAVEALGLVLVIHMLMSIRNAWDLVTWLAPRARPAIDAPSTEPPRP